MWASCLPPSRRFWAIPRHNKPSPELRTAQDSAFFAPRKRTPAAWRPRRRGSGPFYPRPPEPRIPFPPAAGTPARPGGGPVEVGGLLDGLPGPLLSDLQQHLGGVPDGVGKEGVDLLGLQPRLVGQPLDQDLLLPGHPPAVLPVEEAAEQIALAKALRPQHHRVDAAAHLAVQTLKGVLPAHVPLPAGDGAAGPPPGRLRKGCGAWPPAPPWTGWGSAYWSAPPSPPGWAGSLRSPAGGWGTAPPGWTHTPPGRAAESAAPPPAAPGRSPAPSGPSGCGSRSGPGPGWSGFPAPARCRSRPPGRYSPPLRPAPAGGTAPVRPARRPL